MTSTKNHMIFGFILLLIVTYAEGSVLIGGNPSSIDTTIDGKYAVISSRSPISTQEPNLFVVDLTNEKVIKSYNIRYRMFKAVFLNPDESLDKLKIGALFGDQGSMTVINASSGEIINDIPTSARPSDIEVYKNHAFVTGSSTGDVTVIDIDSMKPIYTTQNFGVDPRSLKLFEKDGQSFAYVVFGGENSVGVYYIDDVRSSITPWVLMKKMPTGLNPGESLLLENKNKFVVANLSGKSISVFDITTPHIPITVKYKNKKEWPVGNAPTAMSFINNNIYVVNFESKWLTEIDITNSIISIIDEINTSGNEFSSISTTDSNILLTEQGSDGKLIFIPPHNQSNKPLPDFDLVGEPSGTISLPVNNELACPGFYFANIKQQVNSIGGVWGMEMSLKGDDRVFQGGMILKSNFAKNAGSPGYGGFNITNKNNEHQLISINLRKAIDANNQLVQVKVTLKNGQGDTVFPPVSGSENINLEGEIPPGFYYFRVASESGEPAGTFTADILTQYTDRPGGGFQGGINVGGKFTSDNTQSDQSAYVGFCIKDQKNIEMKSYGLPTYGPWGHQNLIIEMADRERSVIADFENSTPLPPQFEYPQSPYSPSDQIFLRKVYVNANSNSYQEYGTPNNPYRSLTKAITKTNRDNIAYILSPGTYSPSKTYEVLPIGSKNPSQHPIKNNVWIIGMDPATTIIDAEFSKRHDGSNATAIQITGVDNIRVSGLSIINSLSVGIYLKDVNNARIDHNFLSYNARFGVGAQNTNSISIDNNLVVGNNESGIVASTAFYFQGLSKINHSEFCPEQFGSCIYNNIALNQRADGILVSQGGEYFIHKNTAIHNGVSGIEINNRYFGSGERLDLTGVITQNTMNQNGGKQQSHVGTGILITEHAHAEEISNNIVSYNHPGGIGVFEDGHVESISNNQVSHNTGNGLTIQKRSTVHEIANNNTNSNGLSGLLVSGESQIEKISNNTSKGNGTCTACKDAKNGILIGGESEVGQLTENIFNDNHSGGQISSNSLVDQMNFNKFNNNNGIGLLVRSNSKVESSSQNEINNNKGNNGLYISDSHVKADHMSILDNKGEGITIEANAKLEANEFNVSGNQLGGIYLRSGSALNISWSSVSNNLKTGVHVSGLGSEAKIYESTINYNEAGVYSSSNAYIYCNDGVQIAHNETYQTLGETDGCNR